MMSTEQREEAIARIQAVVPEMVFTRFTQILCMIEERNNDALVSALARQTTGNTMGFGYNMESNADKDTITPIREVLDLFEGWFITSVMETRSNGRIHWEVESIIGKEIKK